MNKLKGLLEETERVGKKLFLNAWSVSFYSEVNTDRMHWLRIALYKTGLYLKEDEAKKLGLVKLYDKKTSFQNNPEEWYRFNDKQIKNITKDYIFNY